MNITLPTAFALLIVHASVMAQEMNTAVEPPVRFATFNVSLNRKNAGQLQKDLASADDQAHQVAEIIQHVRPDVILLNEFDYDPSGKAVSLFLTHYLGVAHGQQEPIEYAYHYTAPVNTGVPSGRDLNKDGKTDGPADAYGYGAFPGQYGMLVLSRFPFDLDNVRTFQKFLWKDMPGADLPVNPHTKQPYYSADDMQHFRLSSKSHWDLPVRTDNGLVHFLVCHPTPPAFDGPEDRNGCRNHDEIRLWADYIDANRSTYIYDDKGRKGGLKAGEEFVIAGDLNADPLDGGSRPNAIGRLLKHPLIRDLKPGNSGGRLQAEKDAGANRKHKNPPEHDTSNFSDRVVGNLRVDYVLSSDPRSRSGIFWPTPGTNGADLLDCSDHRLVWLDHGPTPESPQQRSRRMQEEVKRNQNAIPDKTAGSHRK
jgi:endonuclease/exonuclease/phosphatase family metal-dependent hydrolase